VIVMHPDRSLLAVARRVLSANGFRTAEANLTGLEDVPWLLAENEYFILAVVAGLSLDDLLGVEGFVSADIEGRVGGAPELGAKRWDTYVVLLTSAEAERGRPEVLSLEYNTRSVRRLVLLGAAPYEEAVTTALRAFLPLPPPRPEKLASAYDLLIDQLVVNGVREDFARAAVAAHRSAEPSDGR